MRESVAWAQITLRIPLLPAQIASITLNHLLPPLEYIEIEIGLSVDFIERSSSLSTFIT